MSSDLPAPLTPADCDLQAFPFMPLHVARLRDSDLAAMEEPEACWYAVLLWSASWHQVPAASLTDDDAVLARLCGLGRDLKTFRKFRDGALRGFVKCSDGRLYHPTVAEQALEAWGGRVAFKDERNAAAERQARWREEQRAMCARLREIGVTPPEKASKAALRALLELHDPSYVVTNADNDDRNAPRNADNEHPVTPVTPKTGTGTGTGTLEEETTSLARTAREQNEPPDPPKPSKPKTGLRDQLRRAMEAAEFIAEPVDWRRMFDDWKAAGADFENVVLPTIRSVMAEVRERGGDPPFRFKFFDETIRRKLEANVREVQCWRDGAERIRALDAQQAAEDEGRAAADAELARLREEDRIARNAA